MKSLIVCDQPDETALLRYVLREIGVSVEQSSGVEEAIKLFAASPVDLWVVALRKGSAIAQIRRVRKDSEACLALIANTSCEDDICEAYAAGADAVMTRPYSARILAACLKALLRRGSGTTLRVFPSFNIGKLTLDPSSRTFHIEGGVSRRLTHLEFRLLHTLMLHHGQTLPAEMIVEHVWGYDGSGDTELVRGLVRRLRSKVETNPSKPEHVITVPGVGYRLEIQ